MDACLEQGLVRIKVADARDEALVEQRPLHVGAPRTDPCDHSLNIEERIKGVPGDVRLRRDQVCITSIFAMRMD